MAFTAPLDLQTILINIFAGSVELFIFVSLIAIAGLSAYFRMINATMLTMFVLFALIISPFSQGIFFLTLLLVALFISWSISRIAKT